MKILVAVNAPSRHLFPLFFAWVGLGHDVIIVADREVGRFGTALEYLSSGLDIRVLERRSADCQVRHCTPREVAGLLTKSDAAVIGGYTTRASAIVTSVPRRRRPCTVMMGERPDHRTRGVRLHMRNTWIREVIRRTDAVWPMSAAGRHAYERLGAEVPTLAPYPLPTDIALASDTRAVGSTRELNIVTIGRLDDRKNPLLAAESLRALARNGVPFRATFYGDGPLRHEVKRALHGLPARLAGQVSPDEVWASLSRADTLLHPCRYDGWGMVVAEAVAAGVAVVSSANTDAAAELARHGKTVRLAELTPDSIAAELKMLSEIRSSTEHRADLLSTREMAERAIGVEVVAKRTNDELVRMAS